MKPEDKPKVLQQVIDRIFHAQMAALAKKHVSLDTIINDTIYHERQRLESAKRCRANAQNMQYWKKINKRLLHASEAEKQEILKEIITLFADEIVGNFNPKVYRFATKILPIFFNVLLNTISPKVLFSHFPKLPDIAERIIIRGEIEALQQLEKLGTVVLVPTHSSNLDSIVLGLAIHKIELPPFTYGAGINLFTNRLISYFMNNLGAYKVDRKKQSSLYKTILKEYTTVTLEYGYHNLFFPGGKRIRSGEIEKDLKLGLLGTAFQAYINNLKKQKSKPDIFVAPCTISYQLVLEAEHLIEDFLKETGKSRYIIEDDEFSQPRRIVNFLSGLLSLDSRIYVTFCPAIDLFGNRVDSQGISYDNRGRQIDIRRYLMVNGEITDDQQRNQEYTRELGQEIAKIYAKNNVILSTNLLGFVVYNLLAQRNPDMDLYRLLRTGGKDENLPAQEVYETTERLLATLRQKADQGEIKLDEKIVQEGVEWTIKDALKHFRIYHTRVVLSRHDQVFVPGDINLLYYYGNRLNNYGLEKTITRIDHARV